MINPQVDTTLITNDLLTLMMDERDDVYTECWLPIITFALQSNSKKLHEEGKLFCCGNKFVTMDDQIITKSTYYKDVEYETMEVQCYMKAADGEITYKMIDSDGGFINEISEEDLIEDYVCIETNEENKAVPRHHNNYEFNKHGFVWTTLVDHSDEIFGYETEEPTIISVYRDTNYIHTSTYEYGKSYNNRYTHASGEYLESELLDLQLDLTMETMLDFGAEELKHGVLKVAHDIIYRD